MGGQDGLTNTSFPLEHTNKTKALVLVFSALLEFKTKYIWGTIYKPSHV